LELNYYQQYVLEEFAEAYHARRMSRRLLLRRALIVTGSVPLTASVLLALGCGSGGDDEEAVATAEPPSPTPSAGVGPGVPENDPAIQAGEVRYPGPAVEIAGYMARPRAAGMHPGIIVIHENQGLLPHFKDVTRRFAKEGFAALAVDLASRIGYTKENPNENSALTRTPPEDHVADMMASLTYLKAQPNVRASALGVTGYCFGGGMTFELAIASPEIKAAVPYYGTVRLMDQLANTRAAILGVYGQDDARVTAQSTEVEQRLRAAGKTVEIKVYLGAGHAFFNEDKPAYNEAAAKDAWNQTLAWFRRHLTA
jgi:carboxymethylenebutenolidase